jgi:hypothetical protein
MQPVKTLKKKPQKMKADNKIGVMHANEELNETI